MKILPNLVSHLGAALIGLAALHAHAAPAVHDRMVEAAGLLIHTLQAGNGPETARRAAAWLFRDQVTCGCR